MPTLLVDSGGAFVNDRSTHGEPRYDALVRNEWILKAYSRYNFDAMNLSVNELASIAKFLKKDEFASHTAKLPILTRLVSANFTAESAKLNAPQPFIVRGIVAADGKPVRVAFIGLSEMTKDAPAGVKITDPIAAAIRILPEARSNADIVIGLSHLSAVDAVRLAREVAGFDVILTGTGEMFTPPIKTTSTLIAFTQYETRFLGELRFYRDEQGKFTVRERYISMDIGVGEEAEALELVAQAREGRVNAVRSMQEGVPAGNRPRWDAATYKPVAGEAPVFISSQSCYPCHAEQYLKWANSKHAKAADVLVVKKEESDASCLQCHGTGVQKAGDVPQLLSVQCEQCHGAGSLHAIKPAKGYGKVADVKANCTACHNPQTSPNFDLQAAWLKIKH